MAHCGGGHYFCPMQNRLPLAIIEDQPPIREMLHQYLGAQPEFECVLTAASMEDFFRQLPALGTPPALVLSDIGLPGRSGIGGCRSSWPGCRRRRCSC